MYHLKIYWILKLIRNPNNRRIFVNFPNCSDNGIAMDKIEFRIAFGKRVEKFRKKLGLSYRELAQKCDVDHSNISKIEKGEVDLRISTIQELAKGLEVHPQELFDFKIDEKS